MSLTEMKKPIKNIRVQAALILSVIIDLSQ